MSDLHKVNVSKERLNPRSNNIIGKDPKIQVTIQREIKVKEFWP
jgi:hypothetical protein